MTGGRGLDHKVWSQTVTDLDDIHTLLNHTLAQGYPTRLDVIDFTYNDSVSSLSSGFLIVPNDGEYSFMISGKNCRARLLLSPDKLPSNLV